MANIFTVTFNIGGLPNLTDLVVDGVTYPVTPPIPLDDSNPTLAADIEAALNGLDVDFAGWFTVTIQRGFPIIGALLTITSKCTGREIESVITDEYEGEHEFTPTVCQPPVIDMEIVFNCTDPDCINFTDKTKEHSLANPTGYGGPNFPALSDIKAVIFILEDKDGKLWTFSTSTYLPNAAGTTTVCLKESDFTNAGDQLVIVKGLTYDLHYKLVLNDDSVIEVEEQSFQFPCCGDSFISDLCIDYSIKEKLGCGSIDLTDETGDYNSLTNPSGYGAPNPAIADIISTIIKITRQDGTVITITDFKPTMSNRVKNINAATLGYPDGFIPPQVVTIDYSVYATGNCRIGYKSDKVLLHCALRNCIVSQGRSIVVDACNTGCNDQRSQLAINLITRYEMLLLTSKTNIYCITEELEALYEECKKYCETCP